MSDSSANAPAIPAGPSVDAFQASDAFIDAVTALMPALRAFGCSLCGDPMRADDLVQETIIKAHVHRQQFRTSTNLKGWLFRILRNCHYSELRRRKFEVEDPEDLFSSNVAIDVDHSLGVQLQELRDALQNLPKSQREALMLVCVAGLRYDTVAHTRGVAVGTIKSRIARARASLHSRLGSPLLC